MKNILLKSILALSLSTALFAGGGGDILRGSFTVDQLEYQFNDEKALSWDTFGFMGYDTSKIYIYSEGEKENGNEISSESELVYSHAIAPFWDIQTGIAYDKNSVSSNTWAQLAIFGLSPYFFETRVALLVDKNKNFGIRTSFEYEALLTQKLILTPSLEVDAYTKDDLEMGRGSGLSNITAGARLRYEFIREFAPYIGIEWSKNFGNTNDMSSLDETYIVAGLRIWF